MHSYRKGLNSSFFDDPEHNLKSKNPTQTRFFRNYLLNIALFCTYRTYELKNSSFSLKYIDKIVVTKFCIVLHSEFFWRNYIILSCIVFVWTLFIIIKKIRLLYLNVIFYSNILCNIWCSIKIGVKYLCILKFCERRK